MAFTNGNDLNILQATDSSTVGAGLGNDRYILSADALSPNQRITISDTQGFNALHLVGGLTIVSSRVTNNALQLTLNNGSVITVLGADTFSFITGGDIISTAGATIQNFSNFVTQSLNSSIPPAGSAPVTGGSVVVNNTGGTMPINGQPTTLNIAIESSPIREGDAGSSTYTYRVTRSGDLGSSASVEYLVLGSGSTPVDAGDFSNGVFPSGVVFFAANQASALFTVSIAGDSVIEPNETFLVSLRNPLGAVLGNSTSVTSTVVDDDATVRPTISIQSNGVIAPEGNSGTTLFTFTVSRSGDLSSNSSVGFALEGSGVRPASANDFTGGSFPAGLVSFAQGQSTAIITVSVAGDTFAENDETFTVRLNNPINATLGNTVAVGTIVNDDATVVNDDFSANASSTGFVPVGGVARGVIETAADVDWFSVNLEQGKTYRIDLTRESGTLDTLMRLLNSNGVLLTSNDDGPNGTTNSQIVFTPNTSDRFFIEARSFAGASSGGYSVSVVQTASPVNNPSRFDIEIDYSGPERFRSFFDQAADRIEQIIVGDLPSANFQGRFVDDILIAVSMQNIDGPGRVLGSAGFDALRQGSQPLPFHGFIELDNADADMLIAESGFDNLVLHEMMHALGFGSLWSNSSYGYNITFGQYTGVNAVREYRQLRGTNESFVPLELTGGQGTANSHWRDDLFRGEVMGAYYSTREEGALSRVTVAALQDLGYLVDYTFADPYRFNTASVSAESQDFASVDGMMVAATPPSSDLMFL